jgi:hypothetical protein
MDCNPVLVIAVIIAATAAMLAITVCMRYRALLSMKERLLESLRIHVESQDRLIGTLKMRNEVDRADMQIKLQKLRTGLKLK